jgi:pimeloyl-ACP methyl ester carboxylesterase
MALSIQTENGVRYIEVRPDDAAAGVETYLLVHGLGGSLEHWANVIEPLGLAARVIAIDVPGFGQSRTVTGEFDLERSVARILDFCHGKNLSACVLVSHSIGSVVAARMAALEPVLFTRLVIVSGTLVRAAKIAQRPRGVFSAPKLGFYVGIVFAAGMMPLATPALQALAKSSILRRATLWPFVAHPEDVIPEDLLQTLVRSGSLAVLRILLTASSIDYVKIMSEVSQPVDLIWGARDHLINDEDIVSTRRLMPVQRERLIADCGHWPWLERPAELIEFITEP